MRSEKVTVRRYILLKSPFKIIVAERLPDFLYLSGASFFFQIFYKSYKIMDIITLFTGLFIMYIDNIVDLIHLVILSRNDVKRGSSHHTDVHSEIFM